MRNKWRVIGRVLWIGSGIVTSVFWFIAMMKWLGVLGCFLAIILIPGIVIFPIVFWIHEGVFPGLYFIIWGVGIVGLIINGLVYFADYFDKVAARNMQKSKKERLEDERKVEKRKDDGFMF